MYKITVERYGPKDGFYALLMVLANLFLVFLQGYTLISDAPTSFLLAGQIIFPITGFAFAMLLLFFQKQRPDTIGISSQNLTSSLLLGFLGACFMVLFQIGVKLSQGSELSSVQAPTLITFLIFLVGAISEEVIYRGIILTRLSGLIKNSLLVSSCTAALFIFTHYPVNWVVSGHISMYSLTLEHIVFLLMLHFLCAAVYKRTNNLWGAILLHVVYNLVSSMIAY